MSLLSSKTRYAIDAMSMLRLVGERPTRLEDIAAEVGVSMSYLEQLFVPLRKHKLVHGIRGPGGGYYLCRPSGEISVLNILYAVGDDTNAGAGSETWRALRTGLMEYLAKTTLADLAAQAATAGLLEKVA